MKIFPFKRIYAFLSRKNSVRHLFSPSADWKINIAAFLIVSVCVISGSLYLYRLVASEKVFNIYRNPEETVRTFDRERVRALAEDMREKEIIHESFRESGISVIDPVE